MIICPVCNKENLCKINENTNQCWCFSIEIDKKLIALLPDNLINKSCICLACITLFKEDSGVIKEMLNIDNNLSYEIKC